MPTNVTIINDPNLIAKYKTNGLTYISDNNDIVPRDKAGNIIVNADTSSNKLLIIEPVTNIYTMQSALEVFDTTFRYFKFPAANVAQTDVDVDIDTTDAESALLRQLIEQDLEIPYAQDEFGTTISYRRLNTSYQSTWYTNGAGPLIGVNSSGELTGATTLPFEGQSTTEPGRYQITEEIVSAILNSGKTIQFDIQMQTDSQGKLYTGYILELYRASKINGSARSFSPNVRVYHPSDNFPVLRIRYKIDPQDIVAKDYYEVRAVSGNPAWYLRDQTYWNISLVDADGNYGATYETIN
jgi:hypothetical protein